MNELMTHGQTLDDSNVEWSVADASGWKVDHYKNSYTNNGFYDDSDNDLGATSATSSRGSVTSLKSRGEVKMINVRKFSEEKEGKGKGEGEGDEGMDETFEDDFKSTVKI